MNELTQQIVDAASQAVSLCESRPTHQLDFTEASLSIVEEMLAEATEFSAELTHGQLSGLVQQFGSYILEVGRREFGGRYLWHDERDQPVLVVRELRGLLIGRATAIERRRNSGNRKTRHRAP